MSPRRVLSAVDDPLDASPAPPARPASRAAGIERRALFVRLPVERFDALARAAFELGCHKQDLVDALVVRYVDPRSEAGLAAMRELLAGERDSEQAR